SLGNDHIDIERYQLGHQLRQACTVAVKIAALEYDVPALDPAAVAQLLDEIVRRAGFVRARAIPDHDSDAFHLLPGFAARVPSDHAEAERDAKQKRSACRRNARSSEAAARVHSTIR